MSNLEQIMPLEWWAIAGLALLVVILLFLMIFTVKKLNKFEKAYLALQTYSSGKNLDMLLEKYLDKVDSLQSGLESHDAMLKVIEEKLEETLDKVEVVRFNAFEKGGSDMSFSAALLNRQGDGVVLTSIQTREDSRLYAKPIKKGKSEYPLSPEEENVINKAMSSMV